MTAQDNRRPWKASVVRRSIFFLVLVAPGFVANFALLAASTYLLAPSDFGIFYLATGIIGVLSAPATMLAFYVARATAVVVDAEGDAVAWRAAPAMMLSLACWSAPMAGVLLVLLVAAGLAGDIEGFPSLVMVALVTWLTVMSDAARGLLQGLQRFLVLGLFTTGWMVGRFVFGIIGIVTTDAAWGGLAGIAIATLLASLSVPLAVRWRGRSTGHSLPAALAPPRLGEIMPFAAAYGLMLSAVWVDVLVAFFVLDRATLGVYAASSVLPKALLTLTLPVLQVTFPVAVGTQAPGRSPTLLRAVGMTLAVSVIGATGFTGLQDNLCGGAWGIRLCRADLMQVMLVAAVLLCVIRAMALVQLARGQDRHPILLAFPVAIFVVWSFLADPDAGRLADGFMIFAVGAALWYAPFCLTARDVPAVAGWGRAGRIVAINLAVLTGVFLVCELGARAYGRLFVSPALAFRWINYAEWLNIELLRGSIYPARYDALLGYVPKPGRYTSYDGTAVTVQQDTTRANGGGMPAGPVRVLAVGDSFTWGDQVSDSETWPAFLERKLKVRVANGGVFGYGIDQSVLRARTLTQSMRPDVLLVGLSPDDIRRTELAMRTGAAKPTFTLAPDGGITLATGEANRDRYAAANSELRDRLGPIRSVLGYSYLAHNLIYQLFPEYWLSNRLSVRVHSDGEAVSCRLMDEIAKLPAPAKFLVVQYPTHMIIAGKQPAELKHVLDCARRADIGVIDSFEPLRASLKEDAVAFADLYVGHMSAKGNRFAAGLIAAQVGAAIDKGSVSQPR